MYFPQAPECSFENKWTLQHLHLFQQVWKVIMIFSYFSLFEDAAGGPQWGLCHSLLSIKFFRRIHQERCHQRNKLLNNLGTELNSTQLICFVISDTMVYWKRGVRLHNIYICIFSSQIWTVIKLSGITKYKTKLLKPHSVHE